MLTPNTRLRGSLANCLGFGEGAIPAAFQSEILREILRPNAAQDDRLAVAVRSQLAAQQFRSLFTAIAECQLP